MDTNERELESAAARDHTCAARSELGRRSWTTWLPTVNADQ